MATRDLVGEGIESEQIAVDVVESEAEFDRLEGGWDALLPAVDLPSPFQSWDWNRAWWRHFARPSDRLRLVTFTHRGELIGIAPFVQRRRFGLIDISPIGFRDRITEYRVPVFHAAWRKALWLKLWDWLETEPWASAGLPQVPDDSFLPERALEHVVHTDSIVFEHLDLPDSWKALDARLNQSMRSNVRYYPKLMVREGHPYTFEISRTPAEVAAAIPTLWTLHSLRAAARTKIRHYDYLRMPARRRFMNDALPKLAAKGHAAIGMLHVHGDVVAAQVWLEHGGTACLYYSGFDPSWSKYSVAMVTTSEIFKDLMARDVHRVEFLRGANHYKSRWGTEVRTEVEHVLARRRRLVNAYERSLVERKKLRLRLERWRARIEDRLPFPR